MPLTGLDHWVSFQPWTLVPYLSLWLYVGIAPGLQRNLRALLAYGLWAGALCATGLLLFYAWPTKIPPLPMPDELPAAMAVLKGVDAGGNACPSMHVAISLFTACWIAHVLRRVGAPVWLAALNWLWFAAIAWSTLGVRQHVLLDVLGGVLLGGAFAWASLRWHPRPD
jgi:membrane-associated phospholipid phosphatase